MHAELITDLKAIETKIQNASAAAAATPEAAPLRHAIGSKVAGKVRTAIEILEQDQEDAKMEPSSAPAPAPAKRVRYQKPEGATEAAK